MALFHEIGFDLKSLVSFIETGYIGLPDIQRPFVWPNTKVRDLFDSIYRGYPVGYLLLWENAFVQDNRPIGVTPKQAAPTLLIVDGQQRLTSLYAVLTGEVVRENYATEKIEIAFDPLHERFEVADAAIRRDPAFIADISTCGRRTPTSSSSSTSTSRSWRDGPLGDADQERRVQDALIEAPHPLRRRSS